MNPMLFNISGLTLFLIHFLFGNIASASPVERGVTTTFHDAASFGNIPALVSQLETNTNLEVRDELGLTPFQVAVLKGHLSAASLLVDKGADVNACDSDGNSLLHQIFLKKIPPIRDFPTSEWLQRANHDPDKKIFESYLVPTTNDVEKIYSRSWFLNSLPQVMCFLLACGINAKVTNNAGDTALDLMIYDKIHPQVFVSVAGRPLLMKLLATHGCNVDRRDGEGGTALHHFSGVRYDAYAVDRIKNLIKIGAGVNATNNMGQTPLHVAAKSIWGWDSSEVADNTPFQLLVKSGANVNASDNQGRTPLDIIATSEHSFKLEATVLLLRFGAKSNDPAKKNMKPLHFLAASKSITTDSLMQSVLESGADPNERDDFGRTPVHGTLTGGSLGFTEGEKLKLLSKSGADFSAKDSEGKTPLHYLAALGTDRPLSRLGGNEQIFVTAKVDFNARDNEGNSPLHIAAKTGASDVFNWLLKYDAQLDVTNKAGQSPRQIAKYVPFR